MEINFDDNFLENKEFKIVRDYCLNASYHYGESDNGDNPTIPRVHAGFREASDSVSRRLKELVIAATGAKVR